MLTDECDMRPFSRTRGIEVMETDLGERIQQLDDEPPSHIVVPAVHKLRGDVAEVFAETIGTDPGNSDVHYLAESQRQHTRPYFLKADAGMTGGNFAVAETGTFVVCTNEGNADLSRQPAEAPHRLDRHREAHPEDRASRRVRPHAVAQRARLADHAAHLALPRRRARAPRCTSCWSTTAARSGSAWTTSGLAQVHPLRRLHEHLPGLPAQRRPELRRDLLRPDRRDHRSDLQPAQIQLLPFASTLNGSCTSVCPVKINIHEQIYHGAGIMRERHQLPFVKQEAMRSRGRILARPELYRAAVETAGARRSSTCRAS